MRLGILYNLVDKVEKGKDIEKVADNEVLEIAQEIRKILEKNGHSAMLVKVNNADFSLMPKEFDCIFNLAEGFEGDAQAEPIIARKLKEAGVAFTGCPEASLALCLDKVKSKEALVNAKINTPDYQLFSNKDERLKEGLFFPLIVKPVHEDASLGITKESVVHDEKTLKAKVSDIIDCYKQPALVEEYIDGREINAALIGNDDQLEVLPLSEIVFNFPNGIPKIVSFDAKWIEDSVEYKGTMGSCPAVLPAKISQKIVSDAKKAFKVMHCNDYARVDFRVRGDDVFALEVNPNPCINPEGAGFVRSALTAGIDYEHLILKLLDIAVTRHKKDMKQNY